MLHQLIWCSVKRSWVLIASAFFYNITVNDVIPTNISDLSEEIWLAKCWKVQNFVVQFLRHYKILFFFWHESTLFLRHYKAQSLQHIKIHRSSHRRCSVEIGVLRKFTGKYLCQRRIFNKVSGAGIFLWIFRNF